MAMFIMSAAEPCIGVFMAVRSPKPFLFLSSEASSGMGRLLPSMVSAYPLLRALSIDLSIYSLTFL